MPCKCKVRSSNHHNNTKGDIPARERFPGQKNPFPGKVSWAEKLSDWERFSGLGREISAQERFLGKVLFLGKVFLAEKSLPRKVYCEKFSCWKSYMGRVFQIVKVAQIGLEQNFRQNTRSSKLGNSSQNQQK